MLQLSLVCVYYRCKMIPMDTPLYESGIVYNKDPPSPLRLQSSHIAHICLPHGTIHMLIIMDYYGLFYGATS